MFKFIKRIFKIGLISLLSLLLIAMLTISYLIWTADMLQPKITEAETPQHEWIEEENYRQWGNNFLRQSETGLWELKVSGDAFERGLARGKLSKDLLYYQEKVFVDQIKEIVPSENYLRFLGGFTLLFNRNLGKHVIEEYRKEIYGISLSCTDEFNYIGTPYERQLNYHGAHDLGHAMQDYMLVGCSSFAAWGNESEDSTLTVGRNFDFYVGDDFAKNKEISFYAPKEGYKYVSISWPGMTGVLSGMNEMGLTVTINAAKSTMPTSAKTPISLLVREILQYASNIEEAYAIAQNRETFVAESILIGSAKDKKAAIIEKSPDTIALFYDEEDKQKIICTNHFQSPIFENDERNQENILTTDSKRRYDRLEELIKQNSPMSPINTAKVLRDRKGIDNQELGLTNELAINQLIAHHSVIFKPEKGMMWVSTSPWQLGKYIAYDLNKIFSDSIDFRTEIYSEEYTIAEDSVLHTPLYDDILAFKRLTPYIKKKTKKGETISVDSLRIYEASNPEYYYTLDILGDYYHAQKQDSEAYKNWKEALTKALPKLAEKERIQKKLKSNY